MSTRPVGNRRRRGLPWFPILTVALGLGCLLYLGRQPELERNVRAWAMAGIPMLVLLLNVIWFLVSPRFPGRIRLTGLAMVVLLGVVLRLTVHRDGALDGRGLPRLAWNWSDSAGSRPLPSVPTPTPAAALVTNSGTRLAGSVDVPQFFGPRRDGVVTGVRLSTNWASSPPKELWRQPVGHGWSAFAVVGDKAYTQEQREDQETVVCYELLTGKPVWIHGDPTRFSQWQGGEGPRATPTVVDGRVYSYGATGLLNCLDATTGHLFWQRSVLSENGLTNIEWGLSASPLVAENLVIVTGGSQGPVVFAMDRTSGAQVWKSGNGKASYSSPLLATLLGRPVVISDNARSLTVLEPATGAVLLEKEWGDVKWPKAAQPVVVGDDRIFLSAGYGMGCRLLRVQREPDGRLAASELWRGLRMKTQFNSASLRDGHLYGLDDGFLACVDANTGERLWKDGRFASGQSVLVDDLVVVQNEQGSVHLCGATPDGFHEFGRIEALAGKTWNHPTVAGRYLLVRNDREAACFELARR